MQIAQAKATKLNQLPISSVTNHPFNSKKIPSLFIPSICTIENANDKVNQAWLHRSKWEIKNQLARLNIEYVEFINWLAIDSIGVVLSFEHQICISISSNYDNELLDGELNLENDENVKTERVLALIHCTDIT